jgi:ubiquinone/menaquinone biosynthesis C-methylase UbiE
MYNAHPFPNSYGTPPSRNDDRMYRIYEEFLHLPLRTMTGITFLDAGCGTGENTWTWRRLLDPSAHVIAVDLSQASVRIAHARGAGQELQPEFFSASLTGIGLPQNSVDVVLCSGVLHHIPQREQAFDELVRVLKPGGYLVLILYHRYGRGVHGLRRVVVNLLAPTDTDQRARLGGQLFGRSMRALAEKEQVPLEGVLYDQFGAYESRHTVGDVLDWFHKAGIDYLGTWPPVDWAEFGKALRFSYRFRRERSWIYPLLLRLFPDSQVVLDKEPAFLTRVLMQLLWATNQQQLFAVSGRKRPELGYN